MGNGKVIARAEEHADEPEYIVSLFLPADYSQHPTLTLPPWFVKLLQARGGAYHTLAEAAHNLEHPATYAKVKQYGCHHQRHTELEVNQRAIMAKIE